MMTLRALPPLLLLLFWMVLLLLLLLDGVRPCSPLAWKSAKILSMSIMPGSVWRRSEERRSLMSAGMSSGVSADGEDALDEDCGDGVEDDEEDEDGDELPWELVDAEVFSTWIEI